MAARPSRRKRTASPMELLLFFLYPLGLYRLRLLLPALALHALPDRVHGAMSTAAYL